jgi:hypothetical protein
MSDEFVIATSLTTQFSLVRLIHNDLRSSNCELSLDLDIIVEPNKNTKLLGGDHELALKSMKFWLETILNQSVVYNVYTDVPTTLFEVIGNHLMFSPGEPDDYLMTSLIHAKLNAIGQGHVIVNSATFQADTGYGFSNTTIGNPCMVLPSIDEWMGENRFYDLPWWDRPDGSMIDVHAEEDEDVTKKPDIFIDIASRFKPDTSIILDKPAEIIKPNFKPVVIDNNQDKTTK